MFWDESRTITYSLTDLLAKLKKLKEEKSFEYKQAFTYHDKEYLVVKVSGLWIPGQNAQYGVVIKSGDVEIKGYVKRSSLYIHIEKEITKPTEIITELNSILRFLPLLEAVTLIPSDAGSVSDIKIIFDKLKGKYEETTIEIPIREWRMNF